MTWIFINNLLNYYDFVLHNDRIMIIRCWKTIRNSIINKYGNSIIQFSSCLPLLELLCLQRLILALWRKLNKTNHLLFFFIGCSSQVSVPRVLQARVPRFQLLPWIPAAGAAVKVPERISRGWATQPISPWTARLRACGALTLSRASRRPWPSTHPADDGKSSCLMRGKCMVSWKKCNQWFDCSVRIWVRTWVHTNQTSFSSSNWTYQMSSTLKSNWL